MFTLYAITDAPHATLAPSLNRESRVISRLVAIALIIAAGSAGTSFALQFESNVLPGREPDAISIALIISLHFLGSGVLELV